MPPPDDSASQEDPFSPKFKSEKDIKDAVNRFANTLRTTFDTFLKGNVQLPLWQPSSELDDHIRRHIADLKIPITTPSSESPTLLLHNLGKPSHDPQLADRVKSLFRPESK